jgi:glycosyltransferase involved in cell wall biosynthesis
MNATQQSEAGAATATSRLAGKRVGMVMFSTYPSDPRPRRAAEALLKEGMSVDLVCLQDGKTPARETRGNFDIIRVPLTHKRGGKLSYACKYSTFILSSAMILALRSIRRRYDLVYVHNMPDVLVASALVPKMLGAKVILDQHDPMPELMTTIFGFDTKSFGVRLLAGLEKWSIGRAHLVITVNDVCKRIFSSRSCPPEKIAVIMNTPDESIFPFKAMEITARVSDARRNRFVMMYHGSLVERNGLDLAVEALAKVRSRIPGVELKVYGRETPFLQRVMARVQEQGLTHCVSYLGPKSLEELVKEIEGCDIGLIPNHRSAFAEINTPTRIFEYLALSKPVIAPRATGISDYFTDKAMIFFDLGDAEDLARKIEYAFLHPAEVAETVKEGQEVYREHCWQAERQRLVQLVSGLVLENRVAEASSETAVQSARQTAG